MKLRKLLKQSMYHFGAIYIRCDEMPEGMRLRLYEGIFWLDEPWKYNSKAQYSLSTAEVMSTTWEVIEQEPVWVKPPEPPTEPPLIDWREWFSRPSHPTWYIPQVSTVIKEYKKEEQEQSDRNQHQHIYHAV